MTLKTIEITAPAYWASYLFNGDASGIEDSEAAACDAWLEREASGCKSFSITDINGESYFGSWFDDWGQEGVTGGDLCDYVALYEEA